MKIARHEYCSAALMRWMDFGSGGSLWMLFTIDVHAVPRVGVLLIFPVAGGACLDPIAVAIRWDRWLRDRLPSRFVAVFGVFRFMAGPRANASGG